MPDLWVDVDTAVKVPVNLLPLLDDTDFKTIETAVVYNSAGLALTWWFQTTAGVVTGTAVTPTDGTGVYDWSEPLADKGIYQIEIPASGGGTINNDTEGVGWFTGVATGVLPWRGPTIGFRAAGLNNLLIDSAYSATRGLAGTAVPDAAADAAGGLAISDAGGLDLDTILGRITGNVALASVVGALADAAADGDPTSADTLMQYVKQLVNTLVGSAGVATFPAEAAPGDGVSLAEVIRAVHADVTGLNGAAMRGTDGAALASAWTGTRAGYLDNLNVGGAVASSAEVTAIATNTRVVRVVPPVIERPDSGTTTYRIELLLYDETGGMEAPDSAPTIALVDQGGTDLSARLDSTTMALVSTGRYRAVYTASVGDDLEQLVWAFSVVEGGATRLYVNASIIVDTTAVDFTASDRLDLQAIAAAATEARLAELDAANLPADVAAVKGDTAAILSDTGTDGVVLKAAGLDADAVTEIQSGLATAANQTTILARLGGWTGTGVNTLLGAFRALLSKIATIPSDIGGTFNPASDSTEALAEALDAAPTAAESADKLIGRNIAGGSDGGRTVGEALATLRNKVDTESIPGFAVVFDVDDTTELFRSELTTSAAAEPITVADPTS